MFQRIKHLILSTVILAFIISFSSCSGKAVKIEWVLIGDVPASMKIDVDIRKENRTIQKKSLSIGKTKSVQLKENETISGLEHDSSLCVMIKHEKYSDVMEIYVYPSWNYIEKDDSYVIAPVGMDVYYYMESFDETVGRNILLISKDNVIEKKAVSNKLDGNLDDLLDSVDYDFAYYINDEQPLAMPYNGYIVKSKNYGNYVFLSTLWGQYSFTP
ncbi:MAG: hypothetical protein IKQ43_12350 [Treponema sp.]|nr:hypothetical protein [Treponema sp.]